MRKYIGIFFYIRGNFRFYKEEFKYDNTKEFIDVELSHYDLFNSYKFPPEYEYSMFPRGRILYSVKNKVFYVYGDKSIIHDQDKINKLLKEFCLNTSEIKIRFDSHYKVLKY